MGAFFVGTDFHSEREKMKQKGFTLIELIVVIAIIGILAAILVPAMMGYVTKSKIQTANDSAKKVYNGLNAAMIEIAVHDIPPRQLIGAHTATGSEVYSYNGMDINKEIAKGKDKDMFAILYAKTAEYFPDVQLIDQFSYKLLHEGCQGVGVLQGSYPGTYPIAISLEDYKGRDSWTPNSALLFALKEEPKDSDMPESDG